MQIYNLHQKHNKTPSNKFNYRYRQTCLVTTLYGYRGRIPETRDYIDVDVVDLRAQADASMPASNNNVKLYNISNF